MDKYIPNSRVPLLRASHEEPCLILDTQHPKYHCPNHANAIIPPACPLPGIRRRGSIQYPSRQAADDDSLGNGDGELRVPLHCEDVDIGESGIGRRHDGGRELDHALDVRDRCMTKEVEARGYDRDMVSVHLLDVLERFVFFGGR